jgi:glucose/arabinose dehydrogenase
VMMQNKPALTIAVRLLGILFLYISCNNNDHTVNSGTDSLRKENVSVSITEDSITELNTSPNEFILVPHNIHLQKGLDFQLSIPKGYNISVAAENLHRLRFLAKSPDGRLFATDMYNLDDNKKGKVYLFEDWDSSTHSFGKVITYISNLHNPNQVAFYDGYMYVAETDQLSRYIYKDGDTTITSLPEVIATFPDYGLSYKYGGWHLTRSLAFHNNKLYVSVGSSCNACVEKEEIRASVIEMNPDGSGKKIFARGLRNSVGIKWIGNKLWVTSMGRDLIGPDKPEDLFHTVEKDGYYGWPFYFQYRQKVYRDERFKDSAKASWVTSPPVAFCGFKAHSAPLGFDHFKNFIDPQLANSFLVALHGSTTVSRQRGNSVVKVIGGNNYVDVVTGFLSGKTDAERHGRPCDVLMNDEHSFFITDDKNGVLYYIWK